MAGACIPQGVPGSLSSNVVLGATVSRLTPIVSDSALVTQLPGAAVLCMGHPWTRQPLGQKRQGLRGSRRELVCKGDKFLPSAQTTPLPAATAGGKSGSRRQADWTSCVILKVTVTSSRTWTGTLALRPTSGLLVGCTVTCGHWKQLAPLCPQGQGAVLTTHLSVT